MALSAKEQTEVDNEFTNMLLTMKMPGIRALYLSAGVAGYAAMDADIVARFSVITENLFHETAPTILPASS